MSIGIILSKIPWFKLLQAVPPIVRTARELMQSAQKRSAIEPVNPEDSDLFQRLRVLEENEKKQSELVQQMSEQLQVATNTLQIISTRLLAVFLLALFAFLIAVTTLILYIK